MLYNRCQKARKKDEKGEKVLSADSPVLSIAQAISICPCQDNMNQIPSSLNSVAILLVSYRTRATHQVWLLLNSATLSLCCCLIVPKPLSHFKPPGHYSFKASSLRVGLLSSQSCSLPVFVGQERTGCW